MIFGVSFEDGTIGGAKDFVAAFGVLRVLDVSMKSVGAPLTFTTLRGKTRSLMYSRERARSHRPASALGALSCDANFLETKSLR